MNNSNLLDLFKISDYLTFDEYLKTDTRNSISISNSLVELKKMHIDAESMLKTTLISEACKGLDKSIIEDISNNNDIEYIDTSEFDFTLNSKSIIDILLKSGRKNCIINNNIATMLYDTNLFSSKQFSVDNKAHIYLAGTIYNLNIYVNANFKWNEPKIILFDDVYINIDNINIVENTDNLSLITTLGLNYKYSYKISNPKLIYLFTDKSDSKYVMYKRDKKINTILNG